MTTGLVKPKTRKSPGPRRTWSKFCRNASDERFIAQGGWFDEHAADHVCRFFSHYVRHTIAPFAGKPFDLAPWQADEIVRPTMGWRHPDGRRRIQFVWVEIPKKNGKTTLLAGWQLYFVVADAEEVPTCLILATKRDQACLTWDEAVRMVRHSPDLRDTVEIHESTKEIRNQANNGKLKAVATDAAGLHGENPYVLGLDEMHAWETRSVWESIRYAGVTRTSPLMICITTAGIVDEKSIGWQQHRRALKIQRGELIDDSTLVYIRAADANDDILDSATHKRANPNFGVTIKPDEIMAAARNTQNDPAEYNNFRRLRLNIWSQVYRSWLGPGDWEEGDGEIDEAALEGRTCFGGLDYGPVDDLTAWVLCFPPVDSSFDGADDALENKFIFLFRFFCTVNRAQIVEREGGAPYMAWETDGHLTLCDTKTVDFPTILAKILDDAKRFSIGGIAVDPYDTSDLRRQISEEGLSVEEWAQSMPSMSGPSKEFKRVLKSGKVCHGNNPIARWMAGNAVERTDHAGNEKPDKGKSSGKIDGVVGAIMAYGMACLGANAAEPEAKVFY